MTPIDNTPSLPTQPIRGSCTPASTCSAFVRCCTCGYQWQRGHNGAHSCADQLGKILESVRRVADGTDTVFGGPVCAIEWIRQYLDASLPNIALTVKPHGGAVR